MKVKTIPASLSRANRGLEGLSDIEAEMYRRGLATLARAARGEVVSRGSIIRAKSLVATRGGSDMKSMRAVLAWAAMMRIGYISRISYAVSLVIDALAALLTAITTPRDRITLTRPAPEPALAGRVIADLNLTPRILAQRPIARRV